MKDKGVPAAPARRAGQGVDQARGQEGGRRRERASRRIQALKAAVKKAAAQEQERASRAR